MFESILNIYDNGIFENVLVKGLTHIPRGCEFKSLQVKQYVFMTPSRFLFSCFSARQILLLEGRALIKYDHTHVY